MSKIQDAVDYFGPRIHGNVKLNQKERKLLKDAMLEFRRELARNDLRAPSFVSDLKLYNAVGDKTNVTERIKAARRSMKPTPYLKALEDVGVIIPREIMDEIMENAMDKNQSIARTFPRKWLKKTTSIPSKRAMFDEILHHWNSIKYDSDLVKMNAPQIAETNRLFQGLNGLTHPELGYFYQMFYLQDDLWEDFKHYETTWGAGEGSAYHSAMIKLVNKIDQSKGKRYSDIENYNDWGDPEW